MEEWSFIMPHRFGSGGFKTARFYGTWRSPVNAQARCRARAFDCTPVAVFRVSRAMTHCRHDAASTRWSDLFDSMMKSGVCDVDYAVGNGTDSVPVDARKWRSGAGCAFLRQTVATV